MALIEKITVQLQTGKGSGADSDGGVYLGLCGREYRLARPDIDDYMKGAVDTYILGANGNVEEPSVNDPRQGNFQTGRIVEFPVYIRFEPNLVSPRGDNWQMRSASVQVNEAEFPRWQSSLVEAPGIWLGLRSGMVIHLSRFVKGIT